MVKPPFARFGFNLFKCPGLCMLSLGDSTFTVTHPGMVYHFDVFFFVSTLSASQEKFARVQ